MMTKALPLPELVNPAQLHDPRPNGYSTAAITPAGARLVHISGQGGQDQRGGLSPDFATQVQNAYGSLAAVLQAMGAGPRNVVKLTTYIVDHDMSKLGPLTQAVMRMFGDHLPAQTLVGVSRLAVDGMLFEVEAVAVIN